MAFEDGLDFAETMSNPSRRALECLVLADDGIIVFLDMLCSDFFDGLATCYSDESLKPFL